MSVGGHAQLGLLTRLVSVRDGKPLRRRSAPLLFLGSSVTRRSVPVPLPSGPRLLLLLSRSVSLSYTFYGLQSQSDHLRSRCVDLVPYVTRAVSSLHCTIGGVSLPGRIAPSTSLTVLGYTLDLSTPLPDPVVVTLSSTTD